MSCEHRNFAANVKVERLEDSGRFAADITIKCAECGEPFQFLGLPGGLNFNHPTVSVDCTEARMPIAPLSESEEARNGVQGFRVRRPS